MDYEAKLEAIAKEIYYNSIGKTSIEDTIDILRAYLPAPMIDARDLAKRIFSIPGKYDGTQSSRNLDTEVLDEAATEIERSFQARLALLQSKANAFLRDKPDASAVSLFCILFQAQPDEKDLEWARGVAKTITRAQVTHPDPGSDLIGDIIQVVWDAEAAPQKARANIATLLAKQNGQAAEAIAFVKGAKWWEYHSTGGTMWQSDQQLVAEEAERQYGYRISSTDLMQDASHSPASGRARN